MSSSESLVRRVEQIHLGDNRYLEARAIEMEWFGTPDEEDDGLDEMETLAVLRFSVNSEEYVQMARLGMVDSVPGGDDDQDRSARVAFRTDRDLLDEADERLHEEWSSSLEDPDSDLEIWNDLDYWEVHEID